MTTRYLLDKSAAYRAHLPAVRHRLEPLMERGLLARCGITDLEFGVSARSREDLEHWAPTGVTRSNTSTPPTPCGFVHGRSKKH